MADPDHWKTQRVRDYAKSRELPVGQKKNPYVYTSFRPRTPLEPTYYAIRRWCDHPEVNSNFSSLLNSLLPGIKLAIENTTEIDTDGNLSIEFNLGRIQIK